MAARTERELRFERRMSDAEALMWNIEKDPWLNPSGATVAVLDRPSDFDVLRTRVAFAVSKIPRLRERVAPELGRLSPPTWTVDDDFDLDYHFRRIALPHPGSLRQLLDLCTRIYEDPYDRTRPLWQFTAIDGGERGPSALLTKFHHTLSDGIGAMRLSALYLDRERSGAASPPVDLAAVLADAAADERAEDSRGRRAASLGGAVAASAEHLLRRHAGIARRTIRTAAAWSADPGRAVSAAQRSFDSLRTGVENIRSDVSDASGGSPLWRARSRRRHLEVVRVPLDDLKIAGQRFGASINDMFVAGAVVGALRYHDKRNTPVRALNLSFVVSTRTDEAIGGNSFSPTRVQVSGAPLAMAERVAHVRDRMAEKRSTSGGGNLAALAGIANLLPTSVVTSVARSQVRKLDFATSNLRGSKSPLYVAGSRVLFFAPMGPVAGTAFNMTTISYNGGLDIGLLIDPAAVADPVDLRTCLSEAYKELVGAHQ